MVVVSTRKSKFLLAWVWGVVLLVSLGLSPLAKVSYIWDQFWYGVKLIYHSKTVEEVLADSELEQRYGTKIRLISQVKSFAQSYGLNTSSSYHTMVFPPGNPRVVSYLVVAAEKLSLTPVTYWFPFAGRVPYLGFFEKEQRDKKAEELRPHYDVYLSAAGAFSLLGYLDDPIFPSMLSMESATLTASIIHELVHASLWIRGSSEFNEQLAEFISIKLTTQFLQDHEKKSVLNRFLAAESDSRKFHIWLQELKGKLSDLYQKSDLEEAAMLRQKQLIYSTAVQHKPTFEVYDRVGKVEDWNNARVVLNNTYSPDIEAFSQAIKCVSGKTLQQQMPSFIEKIRAIRTSSPLTISQVSDQICL